MVFRLARRVRDFMTDQKINKTEQRADYDPVDLATIRAALTAQGYSPADVKKYAFLVRLVVRDWATALKAGEKPYILELKRMIDQRYNGDIQVKQVAIGVLDSVTLEHIDTIFKAINTPTLKSFLETNRQNKAPNRKLIIFLAIKRFAQNLPTEPTT